MRRSKVGSVVYYCRTYQDQSKTACTKHTIKHDRLEAAVLCAVQQQVSLAVNDTGIIERSNRAPLVKSQSKKRTTSSRLRRKCCKPSGQNRRSWKTAWMPKTRS